MTTTDAGLPTGRPGELRLAYALLFVAPALWSVNYLVARWAPGVIAPHALALGRWFVAALLLAFVARHELRAKRALIVREWRQFLVLGALGMWGCGAFVYIGGRSTTAVNIGLLYATAPVFIAVASGLFLRERFGALQWLGVALALGGVLHILIKGQWQALTHVRIAYSFMRRTLGAARVAMVLYLGPLYSAAIAWAVLGERIEWFHGIGALLILPGIWLSTRR